MILMVVISLFPLLKSLELSPFFVLIHTKPNSEKKWTFKNVSYMSLIYPFIHLSKTYFLCSYYEVGIGNKVVDEVWIIFDQAHGI